jgi:rhamnosyltransferase
MTVNRLCIFTAQSHNETLDDYVNFYINAIKPYVSHLVIVLCGNVNSEELASLKTIADEVFTRPNEGFPAAAIKDCLTDYLGFEKVCSFSELLIADDSVYGPIYPLDDIFEEIRSDKNDFFGITNEHAMTNTSAEFEGDYLPAHINTYFINIMTKLLHSADFSEFVHNIPTINSETDSYINFELKFTEHFENLGYSGTAYIDGEDFSEISPEHNYPYCIYSSYRLLSDYRCPFVKKAVFTDSVKNAYRYNSGETARRTLDFIKYNTDYNDELIWQNLLHISDINDLRNQLHLNFIINSKRSDFTLKKNCRAVLLAHIYYPELVEKCLRYIKNVPSEIDIIISVKDNKNAERITSFFKSVGRENIKIISTKNRAREFAALLIECREELLTYDYIGFVHDKKRNSGIPFGTIAESFYDLLWENTIGSSAYIKNVTLCFEENPKLGFLAVPAPYSYSLASETAMSFRRTYDSTKNVLEKVGAKCNMSSEKHPFVIGTAFWCRAEALFPLLSYDWKYDDFPPEPLPFDGTLNHGIERSFGYVAQSAGYYSGIAMTEEYASLYSVNYQAMYNDAVINSLYEGGISHFNSADCLPQIRTVSDSADSIYIYGAGYFGRLCLRKVLKTPIADKLKGFIVSDGKSTERTICGFDVYELSEVKLDSTAVVIIAMNINDAEAIKKTLKLQGFNNTAIYIP